MNKKITTEEFIQRVIKIHKNKYDYSETAYVGSEEKLKIICLIHGSFYQYPNNHLKGHGCSRCVGLSKLTTELFLNKSKLIHGNKYDYSDSVYFNTRTPLKIICKLHGEFYQSPNAHLSGKGCDICNSSKGEIKIINFLENNSIIYEFQKKFEDCKNPKTNRKLPFDFYIPSKNLLIEYDGEQHFNTILLFGKININNKRLDNIKFKDKIKTLYTNKKGIKLLRINYKELNKIDCILNSIMIKQ
jgi:hypothetical protein